MRIFLFKQHKTLFLSNADIIEGIATMEPRDLERSILLSLLNLTREAPVSRSILRRESRVSSSVLRDFLERLSGEDLILLYGDRVEVSPTQRIRIAVRAIALGGDLEKISRGLGWSEFENFVALAFKENGYSLKKHLRFRSQGRRWEIDLIAMCRPLLILVECKHWLRGLSASVIKKTVKGHLTKTQAFTEVLLGMIEKIGLSGWTHAMVVPALVNLTQSHFKFFEDVPIVPVLQLPSFLSDLPAYTASIKHLRVDLSP